MSVLRTARYDTNVDIDPFLGTPNQQQARNWVHVQSEGPAHLTVNPDGSRVQHAKLSTRVLPVEYPGRVPIVVRVPFLTGGETQEWTPDQVRSLRDVLEALQFQASGVGQDFELEGHRPDSGVTFNFDDLGDEPERVLGGWKGWVEPAMPAEDPVPPQDGTTEGTETPEGTSGGSDSSEADDGTEKPVFKKARLKKDGQIGRQSVAQMQFAFGVEPTGVVEGQPAEYQGLNDALSEDAFVWDSGDGDDTIAALQTWLSDQGHFEGEVTGQWSTDLSHAIERLAGNKKETTGVVRAKSQAAVTLQREINRLNGYKEAGK